MNLFDIVLTRPIFNILALIYNVIPDFGISIIISTILIRLVVWPLVKKQLHQAKLMREIQPEIKRIKKMAKGNKTLETTMIMTLYKERGVKLSSSFLVLLIQLPIIISLYNIIRIFSNGDHDTLKALIYPALANFGNIPNLLNIKELNLLGLIDLSRVSSGYLPAVILLIIASVLSYFSAKQLLPKTSQAKTLKNIFKDASNGQEVDQAEISAAVSNKFVFITPVIIFLAIYPFPCVIALYYLTTSAAAILQQGIILHNLEKDLESDSTSKTRKLSDIPEAEIVKKKDFKKDKANNSTKTNTSNTKTTIRRIKAK